MARVASDVASPYLAGTFLIHFYPEFRVGEGVGWASLRLFLGLGVICPRAISSA